MICSQCGLRVECRAPVPAEIGDNYSGLLIVGEAPGRAEDAKGRPFIGESGELLMEIMKESGIARDTVSISNICRCFPSIQKTPSPEQAAVCTQAWLLDEITALEPKVILALGKLAAVFFSGNAKIKIAKASGTVVKWLHPVTQKEYAVVLGVHPAYVLRNPADVPLLSQAVQVAMREQRGSSVTVPMDLLDLTPMLMHPDTTEQDLSSMLPFLQDPDVSVVMDLETSRKEPYAPDAFIVSMAFTVSKPLPSGGMDEVYFVLWRHDDGGAWESPGGQKFLTILRESRCGWIGHHVKFDAWFTTAHWAWRPRIVYDTMIAHSLTEESSASLKKIAWSLTPYGGYEEALDYDIEQGMQHCPLDNLRYYNGADVVVANFIYRRFIRERRLKGAQRTVVMDQILAPASMAVPDMESGGIRIDVSALQEKKVSYATRIIELDGRIRWHAEVERAIAKGVISRDAVAEMNIASSEQLGTLLYGVLGYPIVKETAGGKTGHARPSTDKEALKLLSQQTGPEGVAGLLLEYRRLSKLKTTYLDGLEAAVVNGRVYPTYWIARYDDGKDHGGTVTGRLSCSNPSLHTIPRDSDIKELFLPEEDEFLCVVDFSQLEVRVVSVLAQDARMRAFFLSGQDLHRQVAAAIGKKPPEDVTDEERKRAKTITFGLLYGKEPQSLSVDLGITLLEAQKFYREYFQTFPDVARWREEAMAFARKHGWCATPLGRIRTLQGFSDSERDRRSVNSPIQSTASDICLNSLVRLYAFLRAEELGTTLRGTVHDSILLSVPEKELDMIPEYKRRCEDVPFPELTEFGIPFSLDVQLGMNWGNTEKILG